MFEYTSNKKVILLKRNTFVLDIVNTIVRHKNCFVWIELMPQFIMFKDHFERLGVKYGINSDAEEWLQHIWHKNIPPMNYISHWEIHKPITMEAHEEYKQNDRFNFD